MHSRGHLKQDPISGYSDSLKSFCPRICVSQSHLPFIIRKVVSPLPHRNHITEEACAIMDVSYQLDVPKNMIPGELKSIKMLRFTVLHDANAVQLVRRILVRYLVGSLRGMITGCELLVPSRYEFPTLQDTRGYGSHVSHPHHLKEFKATVVEGTYALVVAMVGNRGIEGKSLVVSEIDFSKVVTCSVATTHHSTSAEQGWKV